MFVEEERENAVEAEANASAVSEAGGGGQALMEGVVVGGEGGDGSENRVAVMKSVEASDAAVTVRNLDSVKGGELLMDSLDLVEQVCSL